MPPMRGDIAGWWAGVRFDLRQRRRALHRRIDEWRHRPRAPRYVRTPDGPGAWHGHRAEDGPVEAPRMRLRGRFPDLGLSVAVWATALVLGVGGTIVFYVLLQRVLAP